jgi:hypothetical protein
MRSVAAFGLIEIATAGIGTSSTGSVGSLSLQDSKVVAAMTQNSEFGERTLRAKRTDPAMVHLRIEDGIERPFLFRSIPGVPAVPCLKFAVNIRRTGRVAFETPGSSC